MKTLLKESGSPLENYRTDKPCLACGIIHTEGNEFHHLITQKNRGPDKEWNLMPLCHTHHVEVHKSGLVDFAKKFKKVNLWLLWNNWEMDHLSRKWRHFA